MSPFVPYSEPRIEGYGPLIDSYFRLVVHKIEFANKYTFLPGTLNPPGDLEAKVGETVDAKFEFVLEVLDYLEALMSVQVRVRNRKENLAEFRSELRSDSDFVPWIPGRHFSHNGPQSQFDANRLGTKPPLRLHSYYS